MIKFRAFLKHENVGNKDSEETHEGKEFVANKKI